MSAMICGRDALPVREVPLFSRIAFTLLSNHSSMILVMCGLELSQNLAVVSSGVGSFGGS